MVLCSLSIVAYTVMQLLFGMVIKPDLMTMQIAVIFSWLFVLCLITVVFPFFSVMTKAEKDKQMQEILQSENALMARNYQLIHADKVEALNGSMIFNHHLKVMRELVRGTKNRRDVGISPIFIRCAGERKCSLSLRKRYY